MIRGNGGPVLSAYSQTLNWYEPKVYLIEPRGRMHALSGPFLVSRTGDEG